MSIRVMCCLGWLALGACYVTHGDVEHPKPGEENTPEYCARSAGQEGNCMACASRPGCGYCAQPLADAALCQPAGRAGGCGAALITSTAACEAPPPSAAK